MSVNIGIAIDDKSFNMRPEPVASFNDDGYYWFLHPLFEDLCRKTGQYIDLYGDAAFSGPTLMELGDTIERARTLIERQPETWEVHVGIQTAPVRRELYSAVEKKRFQQLLVRLDEIVAIAKKMDGRVVCFGD